jgi:protein-tyrosine phosphatase
MWICGKDAICPDPGKLLTRLEASAVVCLVEESELIEYPGYVAWMTQHAPEVVTWCPIPDTGAPNYAVALDLIDSIIQKLQGGQSIVLHCSAGIGRSGMIAAALLTRLGVPVTDAVEAARRCRGASPEAGRQRQLVERVAAEL